MPQEKIHYYFSLIHFQLDDLDIHLVMPQSWQAIDLYQAIAHDRVSLGKWLPWAYQMKSAQDEASFIQTIQEKMIKDRMVVLTILVNGEPSGMIDLHNLVKNQKGEIGYWLSSTYQGRGIVTNSVLKLCQYAFSELNLQYVDLIVAVENGKSARIARNADFKLMGMKKNLINDKLDGQIFRKINPIRINQSDL
ncbi:GNAT family N-acetyltransferase [Lactobacillus kefiranofaciens]|uniref:GNAT family protein n=1 Tax=Lactobacillus kefiranofaciens TaxID=267818 RepID=A0AAX3UDA1_9LACO|nr:GNAT family protein [Lactobacillus kefiranofaciens]AEG41012.1 Acetyltransferase [Lactobacillus kefiranofaciens subsp. kefiranofaciens]KRL30903.1 acetyltransferase [Lactobacillus kefiranofaciens subsp. kefirgranum DSM 10550 = JCM 8572]KRM20796.1 acetyltransferase [Lactobacillus kefiranofaciens subsp. kefiranofaciens DSM 5016 = JCM 6985]MCJ2173031.1 GNAT family N-acetyltransferase [Lactobacillus kefiranofaciens]MCP9331658.1 GNAT family N-acetyltransferase [Lactobacillus kefiranofaciens]